MCQQCAKSGRVGCLDEHRTIELDEWRALVLPVVEVGFRVVHAMEQEQAA